MSSKAIIVQPGGGYDKVLVGSNEAAAPNAGEITVRLHANSLNYHDFAVVSGMWGPVEPRIPMADGAGEVIAVGAGVTDFSVGDSVVSTFFPTWQSGEPLVEGFATVPGDGVDGYARETVTASVNAFKGHGMTNRYWLLIVFKIIGLVSTLMVSLNADAGLFGLSRDSWKEEALLHDGHKMIVERSQTRGGRHEIGQSLPIMKWSITFTLPNSSKSITWESPAYNNTYGSSLGLLALDVVNGVPYIVTTTDSCRDYNKWGRPNPPYMFFRYEGKSWQRIPLAEFPAEIKEANVVNNTDDHGHDLDRHVGMVTADEIKEINGFYRQEVLYQKVFVREPIKNVVTVCSKFE